MGNNIFQWAFARVLSKTSGVPLACRPIPLFPITEKCRHRAPRRIKFALPMDSYEVDLHEWVEKAKQANILIRGYPHNIRFFEPNRDWLVRELVPRDGDYARANERDIVLHVRLGDYFDPMECDRFGYPTDVFARLLKSIDYEGCLIVTDSPESAVVTDLIKNHRGILVSQGLDYDYRTLYHASRLVMSPSTFCWWAAWTGHGKEIYQPYEFSFWRKRFGFALDLPGPRIKRFDSRGRLLERVPSC